MRKLVERREIHAGRAGIFGNPCLLEQRGKGIALFGRDRDDAPGGELAMIGRAQREFDDRAQFVRVGPRDDHVARLARAARGEVAFQRRGVVEHRAPCGVSPASAQPRRAGRFGFMRN